MKKPSIRPASPETAAPRSRRISRAQRMSMPVAARGFTLIELLVTIAVLAIILSLAAPNFRDFIINSRLTSQINDLVADISLARSEAASRSAQVAMCASADLNSCANAGDAWQSGRIIFIDTNSNGIRDGAEQILKKTESLGGATTLIAAGFPNTSHMSFRPYGGLLPATGGSFLLCDPALASGRSVVVSATGRPAASKVTCP